MSIISFILLLSNAGMAQGDGRKVRIDYEEGTVLSSSEGRFTDPDYFASTKAYDPLIFGIATGNRAPRRGSDLIIETGVTWVKFNTENGAIIEGDLVTTSAVPGEAMKGTLSGFMVGVVLETPPTTGHLVKVRLIFQYVHF